MKANSFFQKVIRFLKNYLFKSPAFVFKYATYYFQDNFVVYPQYMSNDVFLKAILAGKTFIRLGDGEMMLLHDVGIDYQKPDRDLKKSLKSLIVGYNKNSNFILGIPERYIGLTNAELKEKGMLHTWLPFKVCFQSFFPQDVLYTDAHMFYVSGFFENRIAKYLKDRKLIIVTTKENIDSQREYIEKIFSVAGWIHAKAPNPYDGYWEYIFEIERLLAQEDKKNTTLILSAGPASKPLAHYFSEQGVQSLDIGHGFAYLYKKEGLDAVLK